MFKISKLEQWGNRIPTLEPPVTHRHEFDRLMAAFIELELISKEYPRSEIVQFSPSLLEVKFKLKDEKSIKEFGRREDLYARVIYFITEE